MGIVERKEREKKELKARILEVALDIFEQEGFEAVSVRRIAEVIEYSPTTIYLHFKDKNEIFYELRSQGFALLMQMHDQYTRDKTTTKDKLYGYGKAYIDFALSHPHYYKLMFVLMAPLQTEAMEDYCVEQDAGKLAWDKLMSYVAQLEAEGPQRFPATEVGGYYWHALVHGLVSLHIQKRVPCDEPTTRQLIYAAYEAAYHF